jgi:hypothetical protein
MADQLWYFKARGLPFKNETGETIPPFACMGIESTEIEQGEIILSVRKPNAADAAAGSGRVIFNDEIEVPDDGGGFAHMDNLIHALEASSITALAECGPVEDEWELASSGTGFTKLAADTESATNGIIVRANGGSGGGSTVLVLTPGGGIAARSGTTVASATCSKIGLTGTTLGATSGTIEVWNPWPMGIPGSFYILAKREAETGFYFADFPGVLNVRWDSPDLEQTWNMAGYSVIDTAEECV